MEFSDMERLLKEFQEIRGLIIASHQELTAQINSLKSPVKSEAQKLKEVTERMSQPMKTKTVVQQPVKKSFVEKIKEQHKKVVEEVDEETEEDVPEEDVVEVFQICRIKGVLLIVNMQSIANLDKSIRSKFHMHSTCNEVIYQQGGHSAFVVTQTRILKPHYYKPEAYSLPVSFINHESGLRHVVREFRIKVAPDKLYEEFKKLENAYKKITIKSKVKD